jgi:hypothetical protein
MDFIAMLSVGSLYQNIAFYTFILFLISLNFDVLRIRSKQKGFKSGITKRWEID